MSDFWESFWVGALVVTLGCIWLAPLGTALFDLSCWLFTASQCTHIDWNTRLPVALAWTVACALVAGGLG